MKDGITEITAIIVSLIVLAIVPLGLKFVEGRVRIESYADRAIADTLLEVNGDESLSIDEMAYILRISSYKKLPIHFSVAIMEGINDGNFGDYAYKVEEMQLYDLLETNHVVYLPEGGIVYAYR